MSDERDDEGPDDESPDDSPEEAAGAEDGPWAEGSAGDSAEDAVSDDSEEFDAEAFREETAARPSTPRSGPAVLDMADLESLDDSDLSIEVEGLEPSGGVETSDDELSVDLSDFDAESEGGSALEAELDAARTLAEELRRERHEAESQVAVLRDQLRRSAADFENYRKRMERDRREEKKHAASGLVLKLLAVTDNFQRALSQGESAARENEALAGFVDGVRLIESQFFDILRGAGLEPVSAEGVFDPAVHEALMQEPSADAPHLSILEVFERGYLFGGRLLRPARVKVADNPAWVEPPAGDAVAGDAAEDGAVADDTGSEAAGDSAGEEPQQDGE